MTGVVEEFSPAFTALDKMPFRIVDYFNMPDLREIIVCDVRRWGATGSSSEVMKRTPKSLTMFRIFFVRLLLLKTP